jgi:hypothetical protein
MVRLMICREHPMTYDARARLAEIVTASDMVAAPSLSLVDKGGGQFRTNRAATPPLGSDMNPVWFLTQHPCCATSRSPASYA